MTKLVIVESPTKAKTIRNFLPEDYLVEASMGHVRDLPSSASEIPADVKGLPWARLGVNVENDFAPLYVVPSTKQKVVTSLKKLVEEADELLLATDEDREGESIGWHLTEVLNYKGTIKRMVFHEITREAIEKAITNTRGLDLNLVRAQEARRILDRLVGYTLSPLLWKKIAPRLSAGRVQSVAVRLLVLREQKRRDFRAGQYWDIKAQLNKRPDGEPNRFESQLVMVDNVRLATGRDFDENTGTIPEGKQLITLDETGANELAGRLKSGPWTVKDIEEKEAQRTPAPPFTTATLQMEANRKLNLGSNETMRIAQKLYENGYITYMRTDSVNLSDQAITAARKRIQENYGEPYLSPQPRRYKTKSKGAQEAHEAIRPAGAEMPPADQLPLTGQERSLYDLIWKRSIATQMAAAQLRFQTVTIEVQGAHFRASGRRVEFPGFFRAYVEGSDDPEAALEHQEEPLPALTVGEELDCRELKPLGHQTKPPARFTEASLVKALEAEGIGRPSTYASIITTIVARKYVQRQRKELVPTFTAFSVTHLLEEHFPRLVDLHFTAEMEQQLDDIATGDVGWLDFLQKFYLGEQGLSEQVSQKEASVDPRTIVAVRLPERNAEVRIGQYGPFLLWGEGEDRNTASLPPDLPPADLSDDLVHRLMIQKTEGPQKICTEQESGLPVFLKVGPYGPYVQLGEDAQEGKKPKRISLLKGMKLDEIDEVVALKLLSLPRNLGKHPETGKVVKASVGRFGPYVLHDRKYVSIKVPERVLDIEMDEAVELIKNAPEKKGRGSRKTLKELGDHPEDGKPVLVLDGAYGPYVKHGRINATLPKDQVPEEVTMEQAVEWIEAKAAKKGKKKATKKKAAKKTAKKKTKKKAAKKKTKKKATKKTAKKTTAKKAAADAS
jgi:DNA topoisomerase-1